MKIYMKNKTRHEVLLQGPYFSIYSELVLRNTHQLWVQEVLSFENEHAFSSSYTSC